LLSLGLLAFAKGIGMLAAFRLAAALTIGACTVPVHAAPPADAPPSDSFVVALPGPGAVLFWESLPENAVAESAAVFGLPPFAAPGTGALVAPGALTTSTLPLDSVSSWVGTLRLCELGCGIVLDGHHEEVVHHAASCRDASISWRTSAGR
jgi:hypothetical protein